MNMDDLNHLFDNNQKWAQGKIKNDPEVFKRLSKRQNPKYLWIGCADSRIPANEVLGLEPGEVFVHRNVANIVPHADINSLSVLQFGVECLEIEHIIVCGHYGCGGVQAVLDDARFGLVDNWLRFVRDVYFQEKKTIDAISDPQEKWNRLVELNVMSQVTNVCHTTIVQDAWSQGKKLSIHGWVYDVSTGLLRSLTNTISSKDQISKISKES